MQLILWRHASASHYTGYDRALDPIGHKQAEQGGQWLAAHYPATPVYTSAALRAQETAAHYPFPSAAFSALNPGKSANAILDFLTETGEERLIAVGHLPWIGQLAAQLRGEHGYFPFNHGMILVFDGDAASGWQMTASFQPQPVSG